MRLLEARLNRSRDDQFWQSAGMTAATSQLISDQRFRRHKFKRELLRGSSAPGARRYRRTCATGCNLTQQTWADLHRWTQTPSCFFRGRSLHQEGVAPNPQAWPLAMRQLILPSSMEATGRQTPWTPWHLPSPNFPASKKVRASASGYALLLSHYFFKIRCQGGQDGRKPEK